MAIIKCPECGQEISDLSDKCIKCGYPIILNNKEIETDNELKLAWKILVPLASILIISLIVALINNIITDSNYEDGMYRGIEWRTSFDDVLDKSPLLIGKEVISTDERYGGIHTYWGEKYIGYNIENYDEYDGFQMWVLFKFNNEGLYEVEFSIPDVTHSKYSLIEMYDIYEKEFDKLFGECTNTFDTKKVWETKYSIITLYSKISAEGYKQLRGFTLVDKTYSE